MPHRNQSIIRRDINRLKDTIERNIDKSPALKAIHPKVSEVSSLLNIAWQNYQSASIKGDKEREERQLAVEKVVDWVQTWRPVVIMSIPGADSNIHIIPSSAPTPDDTARAAEDMVKIINLNPASASYKQTATDDLGDGIASLRKETSEASAALLAEVSARQAFTDSCITANNVLIRGTEVIRAIFGRTSPEYKQFIARASSKEEETTDNESATGEV